MLGWILRFLIAVLLIRAVWGFIAGVIRGVSAPRQQGSREKRGISLARDPVCGTFVEPARALQAREGSTVHYFCSEDCRQSFRRSA